MMGVAAVLLVGSTAVTGRAAEVNKVKVYEPPYVAAKGQDVVRLTSNPVLKANPALEADAYAAISENVLWSFDGDDGEFPVAGLIADKRGNLYGATGCCGGANGGGTVFELSPPSGKSTQWSLRALWSFPAYSGDGVVPFGTLLADKWGNLYGTTNTGGANCPSFGCGTVFELSPPTGKQTQWSERVLYSFGGPPDDGQNPYAGLIADKWGNLYGTTLGGGANFLNICFNGGCGVAFELSPPTGKQTQWSERVLWNFGATSDDSTNPFSGLIADKWGNLYGATQGGGAYDDSGTVFELRLPSGPSKPWSESVLWSFSFETGDGWFPFAGLTADEWGNLYGTTQYGGTNCPSLGCGTVFELTPPSAKQTQWSERVLWSFGATSDDGEQPLAALIADRWGDLYGTTSVGGASNEGTVFAISAPDNKSRAWNENVLWSFDGDDGNFPYAGLIADSRGNLYGTTFEGGENGIGTAFKLSVPGWGQ
jgi:uncharacterized repeat protein (TIGR03803 family)